MAKYLISFPSAAMVVPAGELEARSLEGPGSKRDESTELTGQPSPRRSTAASRSP